MTLYIITEELLQEAMENTTWGRTNQQKFRDKLTPYQSERDKVLDELVTKVIDSVPSPITWVSFGKLHRIIKELRQAEP